MRRTVGCVVVGCLILASPAWAQADRTRLWLQRLARLGDTAAPPEARGSELAMLRQQIADWSALNPDLSVDVPPAPPMPWTADKVEQQVAALRQAIALIAQKDPSQPFYLGVTTVNVTAPVATLSPLSGSLDAVEIQNRRALTVNQAIENLPGVSVDHKAPRNQTRIFLAGFYRPPVPL